MGVKKYTQEVIKEGKRVRWPKKEEFLSALIATLVVCVFCALVLSLENLTAEKLVQTLKGVFESLK